jgi:DNA polymerase III psi subunit
MLSFGVEIAELKLNLSWQNEIIIHETTKIVFAPNLHHLDSDLTAKKLLWGHLQKIK